MSGGQKVNNPDLISFTSPCPLRNGSSSFSSKQDLEDIKFDNNNAAKKENDNRKKVSDNLKAVQNLFRSSDQMDSAPPPAPLPRSILPSTAQQQNGANYFVPQYAVPNKPPLPQMR